MASLRNACDYIIIGGDMNIDIKRDSGNTNYMIQFAENLDLKFVWNHNNSSPAATYESYDGRASSIIDHFMLSGGILAECREDVCYS